MDDLIFDGSNSANGKDLIAYYTAYKHTIVEELLLLNKSVKFTFPSSR